MVKDRRRSGELPRGSKKAHFSRSRRSLLSGTNRRVRYSIAGLFSVMLLFVLISIGRLFNLQFNMSDYYKEQASANQTKRIFTYAPRGIIRGTKGNVLVGNVAATQASVLPYLWQSSSGCEDNLGLIARTINMTPDAIQTILNKSKDNYQPQLLARTLDREQMIILSQVTSQCPALVLSQVASRDYVTGEGLAHVLGYVGQPSQSDLDHDDNLLPSDAIGKTGLEAYYDKSLRGKDGEILLQVDALGRVHQTLADKPSVAGQDITLNIDNQLQKTLAQSLEAALNKTHAPRGAAVALNPKTGAVLALVSLPEYNNNLFAKGISATAYQQLLNDPVHPLVDTAVSGAFPSGSVIKPVVASAALQAGVITPETIIDDKGYIEVRNVYNPDIVYRFNGWDPYGLGPVNVVQAIALSSDIFFYTVGGGYGGQAGLGVQRLTDYYHMFGLGSPTDIDLPFDSVGRVPGPDFKMAHYHQPWTIGDTYNISIGQGDLLVSPLQMTLADMAVANNGYLMQPQIVKSIGGKKVDPKITKELPIDKSHLAVARQGMVDVIKTFNPIVFGSVPATVAGKTGTAETAPNEESDAWFIGYAPADNPKIIIGVFVEHGGEGANTAAPVAAAGLKNYLTNN